MLVALNAELDTGIAMKKILVLLVIVLVGCDIAKDKPINENNITKLSSVCNKNIGLKQAQRVQITFIDDWEWRIDCKDGAKFVIDGV